MHWTTVAVLVIGCLLFLAGYLRLITDDKGHVHLNNYRLTGGLGKVLTGFGIGLRELLAREWTDESLSAALMLGGGFFAALGVWLS
ncbi:MAG: hypothetical protein H3C29_03950 [Simplicispira suum]|uniref:hypothetical protein n=1 Tax=Simplicispira suum TaxID=2109915 RepID=UPI001C6C20D4|nr:hypothetical protein [Simplicispira suum]MBW7832345.1 hypothetical protein [Simplicispira suum]